MIKTTTSADAGIADEQGRTAPPRLPTPPPFWRCLLIGALLVPLSVFFGNYAYVVTQALLWGQTSLMRGPVFVLFLVALLNLAARKIGKRGGLNASEMVVIYSMVAVASCVTGYGMQQFLINVLPAAGYFGTPSNHYERFTHTIPAWLIPHDPKVISDFYLGHASMIRPDILADWAVPVAVWSLFILAMCWTTLCLASLLSKSWIQSERLAFPLVQLPLEMAGGASGVSGFFSNRVMWAGFVLAGLLESVDYINYFYPAMPYLQIKPYHLEPLLTAGPWKSIGTFTIAYYPFAIGIAFLLSLDVSFSCWFFYLVSKAENVVTSALGQGASAGMHGAYAAPPYLFEQGVGAFAALGVLLLWRARRPIMAEIAAQYKGSAAGPRVGLLTPRTSLYGSLAGMGLLTVFAWAIGLPLWIAALFWAVYIVFLVVISRIFAEAGAGWVWGPGVSVHSALLDTFGANMGARTSTAFGMLSWFDSEFRDAPMPHQLEAIKLKEETRGTGAQMLYGLAIATVLAVIAGFGTYLYIYYHFGAASAHVRPALQGVGPGTLSSIDYLLRNPRGVDSGALVGMASGAVVVASLMFLRQWYSWWPLHPVGYALAGTLSMEYMWFPFLLGWGVKLITLRYGGVRMYQRMLPFFFGLILGDYVVPMLWGLWGMSAHTQVYMAFPH